mmetsp:Transcript_37558/g.77940  ORF Transcript_37558/g.77940 Transcript_37558/m.77940 type:complete len:186 (-) Transcript_37558:151-708(-)
MSRAHTPPSTLTTDDRRAMAEVRRDIWIDGFFGMAVGSVSCFALHAALRMAGRYRPLPFVLNKNTALASFLGGGAIGSFVLSTTKGKNIVHMLHPIFERGKKDVGENGDPGNPSSQKSLEFAKSHERAIQTRRTARQVPEDPEEERMDRERNRLFRRSTLQNALNKEGGLSDSHGGHWPKDDKTP